MTWQVFLIAFAVGAAAADLLWNKIPRWLTTAGFGIGIGFHAAQGGVLSALFASFLAFALGLALFQLGAIGGGDVKLVVALGALLGLRPWLQTMEIAVMLSAAFAVVQLAAHRALAAAVWNMLGIVRWIAANGLTPHPQFNVRSETAVRAPFGVPAGVAVVLVLLLHGQVWR